jgi:hypothetical protein
MSRNIRTLYNYEPPATEEEMRASALQYDREVEAAKARARAAQRFAAA